MKMMKTAILTASILASASIFAGNASVNVGANAQVESDGMLSRIGHGVTQGVSNTAHAVHSTAVKATDATIDAGSHVAHKTHDVAVSAKDKTVNAAEKVGDKSEQAWQDTKRGTKKAVNKTEKFTAEQKAKAKADWAAMKNNSNGNQGINAQTQTGVKVGSVNANAGVATNASTHNLGVQGQAGIERQPTAPQNSATN
ncbi:hypothetical protein [Acinetobacter ursingii]|uniref:hypothetical protein n=1 Tax=Acinetobacter ursingii TaxID=108980 RepID=UPI00125053C1|nr:hypothetical protein [Acinetobacter ursingii]